MKFLIVAAKTGGHVFPAVAIANKLIKNNHKIVLIGTDSKIEKKAYEKFDSQFYKLSIEGFRGKNLYRQFLVILQVFTNIFRVLKIIKKEKINGMIGFGGFIGVPSGIACWIKNIPIFIHEQNAVMGSANKLLSNFSKINFLGFKIDKLNNSVLTGNPIRDSFFNIENGNKSEDKKIKIYITGGSQGANYINENIPEALKSFPSNIEIKHQCGINHLHKVKTYYDSMNIHVEVSEFYDNPENVIKWSDFVISRAGALSLSEIISLGRGVLMIPLSNAIDNHQVENAKNIQDINLGIMHEEKDGLESLIAKIKDIIESKKYIDWKDSKSMLHMNASKTIVNHVENYFNR
tara:strand:- start:19 stop:1062 length:1044 start_codon:yes stop_codon:yes gene_type:complete